MNVVHELKQGNIGVIPTDTLYGLVANARNEEAVERVYRLKGRTPGKPCIILISSFDDLAQFDVIVSKKRREVLCRYWPGPVSCVLPCGANTPEYLHRGTGTVAFRFPNDAGLQGFLREAGPLIAPSANPEGLPPATTVKEARVYFRNRVSFYVDGGVRIGPASTLIALGSDDSVTVIRPGTARTR